MPRMTPRLALTAACVAALCGLYAAPAGAAVSAPTVAAATSITPGSAVLNGSYDTGGVATSYSFIYDTASDWALGGDNANYTPAVAEPAGQGVVSVSSPVGCFPFATCAPDAAPLSPGSKYVDFLYVTYGTGGKYYQVAPGTSGEGTFATPGIGTLKVTSTKIPVKHDKGIISLMCKSLGPCQGRLTVTARIKGSSVTCMSGRFSLRAGKKGTFTGAVAGKCVVAMRKAKSDSIKASFTATLTTGQPTARKPVKLQLEVGKKSEKHHKK